MRGLFWMVGIVVVGLAVYWASPPRWAEAPVEESRRAVRSDSRSLVVRLAKAGQARREGEVRPANAVMEEEGKNSFGVR